MADLSLLSGCLLSQILELVQRMCVKIYFHTSSHNPDNLRLQPLRFGLLKPAVVVSSFEKVAVVKRLPFFVACADTNLNK